MAGGSTAPEFSGQILDWFTWIRGGQTFWTTGHFQKFGGRRGQTTQFDYFHLFAFSLQFLSLFSVINYFSVLFSEVLFFFSLLLYRKYRLSHIFRMSLVLVIVVSCYTRWHEMYQKALSKQWTHGSIHYSKLHVTLLSLDILNISASNYLNYFQVSKINMERIQISYNDMITL